MRSLIEALEKRRKLEPRSGAGDAAVVAADATDTGEPLAPALVGSGCCINTTGTEVAVELAAVVLGPLAATAIAGSTKSILRGERAAAAARQR